MASCPVVTVIRHVLANGGRRANATPNRRRILEHALCAGGASSEPDNTAIEACETASQVFDALNRFFAWLHKTGTDFVAYDPMHIESTRDIVAIPE